MIYNPSKARPYRRRGVKQPGRWEIDLRGTLDNGLEVKRERRVFPVSPNAGRIGKRQAEASAREEFQRWNRHGRVVRVGEKPALPRTGGMSSSLAPSFAQFAPDFLEFSASPNASPKGPNSPGTIRIKETHLRLHLLPAFGSMRMDALTRRDVDRYVIDKVKAGRSRNSIGDDLTTLRRMLAVAMSYDLIDKIPHFRVPSRERGKVAALDPTEAQRFLETIKKIYEPRRALLLELYLRTGLRTGEGLALYPADFALDVERPVVRVTRSWSAEFGYGPPKGRKSRVVPLPRSLAEGIDRLLSERGLPARSKSLHPFSAAHDMRRPLCQSYVIELVRSAGVAAKTRRLHTHMLRHTFGSECARRGVPVLTIKEWMGHVKLDTTMVYVHLVAPDHLRWAELMDE